MSGPREILRLFDKALRETDPKVVEREQREAERRRIQRANGYDDRGEPLRR